MIITEEMEQARKKAWSVEPRYPDNLEYIGMEIKNGRMYRYYKNAEGYWYKSSSTNPNSKY